MAISIFISPPPRWHARPAAYTKLPTKPVVPRERTWEDLAADGEWQAALLAYLHVRRRGGTKYWEPINAVVAESLPVDRQEIRERTKLVLHAFMCLIQEKRVLRFRRKWVATLEPPTIIPLGETPLDRSGRV